jgi:hypothetical protein
MYIYVDANTLISTYLGVLGHFLGQSNKVQVHLLYGIGVSQLHTHQLEPLPGGLLWGIEIEGQRNSEF